MADEPEAAPKPKASPEPAAPELVAAPVVDHFGDAIKAWIGEHIHNSPVSRNTEAYNHLVSVLPHLKAKLAKEG